VASQIRNRHNNVNLTPEEKDRVFTWIDLNAVYYPIYESAYPIRPADAPDQLQRPGPPAATDRDQNFQSPLRQAGGLVFFDRPEMSPFSPNE
jgi:hypothetical protein